MRTRRAVDGMLRLLLFLAAGAVAATLAGCLAGGQAVDSGRRDPGWIWAGAVTPTSARITASLPPEASPLLLVGEDPSLRAARSVAARRISRRRVATFHVTTLEPATRYHYALAGKGGGPLLPGSFTTFAEGAHSFTFAVAVCADTGSSAPVFDLIRQRDPSLFLHVGDLHYENIRRPDPGAYRAAYEAVLSSPGQSALYRRVPVVYVWDDHDYGGDDADRDNPGREAARRVYREVVPHYPLPAKGGNAAIYQAFSVGRVRFLITDSRSEKSPASDPPGPAKTVLGAEQLRWLEAELRDAADDHALAVFVTSLPWIAPARLHADDWGGYARERREVARLLAEAAVPVVVIAGDAHMLAYDDGSNNTYAGSSGPPVFHAGALDRRGSTKGGPYSHGAYPGRGQYGLVDVHDDGGEISVVFRGLDEEGRILLHAEHRPGGP